MIDCDCALKHRGAACAHDSKKKNGRRFYTDDCYDFIYVDGPEYAQGLLDASGYICFEISNHSSHDAQVDYRRHVKYSDIGRPWVRHTAITNIGELTINDVIINAILSSHGARNKLIKQVAADFLVSDFMERFKDILAVEWVGLNTYDGSVEFGCHKINNVAYYAISLINALSQNTKDEAIF